VLETNRDWQNVDGEVLTGIGKSAFCELLTEIGQSTQC